MVMTSQQFTGSVLNRPCLVLNKNWQPIDATTVRDGISDVIAEKALIICPESYERFGIGTWMDQDVGVDEPCIRTVSHRIKVPEVIINRHDRLPPRTVVFSRRNLWRRDQFTCQYCGRKPNPDDLTIDHWVPKSKGGQTTFKNCVLACTDCNTKKDNRMPADSGMRLRKTVKGQVRFYKAPSKPEWSPIYAVKRHKLPMSWSKFLAGVVDDLYWNTELEP